MHPCWIIELIYFIAPKLLNSGVHYNILYTIQTEMHYVKHCARSSSLSMYCKEEDVKWTKIDALSQIIFCSLQCTAKPPSEQRNATVTLIITFFGLTDQPALSWLSRKGQLAFRQRSLGRNRAGRWTRTKTLLVKGMPIMCVQHSAWNTLNNSYPCR